MNTLGRTTLLQTEQAARLYQRYEATYMIDNVRVYKHDMLSADVRFIYVERMNYASDLGHFQDSLILLGEDCLKWCKQANRLVGIGRETDFLSDTLYANICENCDTASVRIKRIK